MKQWEKIIATACVGTELLWMGTVLPAQAAPAAGHFANGAMSHRRSFLARAFLDKGIAAYKSGHYTLALQYFHDADEHGHSKASRYIGLCYENGYGVEKNLKTAVQWYTKAMQRGDVTGTYYLGHMYEDGLGVAVDYTRAREMYEKASYRSDIISAPAQNALGRMYEKGEGVPANLSMARQWYEKASMAGYEEATDALVRLGEPIRVTTPRVMTQRVMAGRSTDIVNGVTQIDSSYIWKPVPSINFSSKHYVFIKNSDGSLTPMDEPWFDAEEIAPGTWKIQSDGDYCYLLEGDSIAVMIDCGYGAGNIRQYAETLTTKPVKYVINTHYHFDHTANDAYFDAAFMTAESIPYATVPYTSFSGITFPRDYPVITVIDGYTLNLGNRELKIIAFPHSNHTLGGIAILDKSRRILFSGDEFLFPSKAELNISLEDFAKNMKRIENVRSDFDVLYAGTGKKDGTMFDQYYQAAMYGISPQMTYTLSDKTQKRTETLEKTADGHIIYTRGSVRPGDQTENAPENIPQGQRATYTYNGFAVSFIVPGKATDTK